MGCDIRERYWFVGAEDSIKAWHDFLFPCSINAYPQLEDMEFYDEEWNNIVFGLSDKLTKLIEEKYPIENEKKSCLGFFMEMGEVKTSGDRACFDCYLDNRNSISTYIFKELLDKYFSGVYMYFRYTGDSYMSNTYCSNDRDMRFFDYATEGTLRLADGWNKIGVLYDGNYTKEEIIDSYRLFLGNTDINAEYIPVFCGEEALHEGQYEIRVVQAENAGIEEPSVEVCHAFSARKICEKQGLKEDWQNVAQRIIDYEKYPELKGTPLVVGTRENGKPYLYRAVAYSKTVKIPECIVDFDEEAFDFDVLYDSGYNFSKEYGAKGYTLLLTDEQNEVLTRRKFFERNYFFDTIKTHSGKVIYDKPTESADAGYTFPTDIPF